MKCTKRFDECDVWQNATCTICTDCHLLQNFCQCNAKWTQNKLNKDVFICSACQFEVANRYNFCPNCGARMVEDEIN